MDKWRDYFWYLLPSPFKLVAKHINQWYILFKVLGNEFDKVQAELERAADETSIATCSDILLPYFAEDRKLYRYPGETNDTFRSRIAMHDAMEELGGTREGILMAVATVGYVNATHTWIPELNGDTERWASFLLRTYENLGDDIQLDFNILIREVRDKKESISQDYYEKYFSADICMTTKSEMEYKAELWAVFWENTRRLVGDNLLDGSRNLSGTTGNVELLTEYMFDLSCAVDITAALETAYLIEPVVKKVTELAYTAEFCSWFWKNTRMLTGERLLDGSKLLTGSIGNIEMLCMYLMECVTRAHAEPQTEYTYSALSKQIADMQFETATESSFYEDVAAAAQMEYSNTMELMLQGKVSFSLQYSIDIMMNVRSELSTYASIETRFFQCRTLDGSKLLDGTHYLDAVPGLIEVEYGVCADAVHRQKVQAYINGIEL